MMRRYLAMMSRDKVADIRESVEFPSTTSACFRVLIWETCGDAGCACPRQSHWEAVAIEAKFPPFYKKT